MSLSAVSAPPAGFLSQTGEILLLAACCVLIGLLLVLLALLWRLERRQSHTGRQEALLQAEICRLSQDFNRQLEQLQQNLAGRVGDAGRDQREINALFLGQMQQYNQGNGQMLEQVRRSVSEQLMKIAGGLQEMQTVALDVRSLKQVLGNVRSRGIIGELQLDRLLADVLAPGQYAAQVRIRPEKQDAVDFAIRLPTADGESEAVLLPVDAKFPLDYLTRLLAAQDAADLESAEVFRHELTARIRQEARKIADLYIVPPQTADFAILYLPTETLFAEVIREGDQAAEIYRQYRVILAGPSSMAAILAGLQAIFRMQTMERRSLYLARALSDLQRDFLLYENSLEHMRTRLVRTLADAEDCVRKAGQVRRKLDGLDLSDYLGPADGEEENHESN